MHLFRDDAALGLNTFDFSLTLIPETFSHTALDSPSLCLILGSVLACRLVQRSHFSGVVTAFLFLGERFARFPLGRVDRFFPPLRDAIVILTRVDRPSPSLSQGLWVDLLGYPFSFAYYLFPSIPAAGVTVLNFVTSSFPSPEICLLSYEGSELPSIWLLCSPLFRQPAHPKAVVPCRSLALDECPRPFPELLPFFLH